MKKEPKIRMNLTITASNANWLRQLCQGSNIPISLFVDSLITAMKESSKDGKTEREAMAMAFEQIAKGLR